MPYCTSCGIYIPEGQGKSCSVCYGDPYYGKDGYYLNILEREQEDEDEDEDEREWKQWKDYMINTKLKKQMVAK